MRDSPDTHSRDNRDPPCVPCRDPVMSRRRDGRGRPAHLVCQIRVGQRAGADSVIDNDTVATTARQLRLILDAIERGDLDASATVRARLEGAATALEALTAGNP